jgi:hypothetical protein
MEEEFQVFKKYLIIKDDERVVGNARKLAL